MVGKNFLRLQMLFSIVSTLLLIDCASQKKLLSISPCGVCPINLSTVYLSSVQGGVEVESKVEPFYEFYIFFSNGAMRTGGILESQKNYAFFESYLHTTKDDRGTWGSYRLFSKDSILIQTYQPSQGNLIVDQIGHVVNGSIILTAGREAPTRKFKVFDSKSIFNPTNLHVKCDSESIFLNSGK